MKITKFDPSNLENLRKDITEALEEVAKKYDLNIKLQRIGYLENNCSAKITMDVKNPSGEVITRESETFKAYASLIGLNVTDLNKTFNYKDQTYQIVGYNGRKKKSPIILKNVNNGKTAECSVDLVKIHLK